MDLTLDDHGVDPDSAVVDCHKAPHLHFAGPTIDVHHADVGTEGIGQIRRVIVRDCLQPGLHALWVIGVGGEGDLLDGLGLVG